MFNLNIVESDNIKVAVKKKEVKKDLKYEDITSEFINSKKYIIRKQKYFIDNDGVRHNVDGKHVVLETTKKEIEVAQLLGQVFGGEINMIPKVNEPEGIKTPDYILNNEKFDLKESKQIILYLIFLIRK